MVEHGWNGWNQWLARMRFWENWVTEHFFVPLRTALPRLHTISAHLSRCRDNPWATWWCIARARVLTKYEGFAKIFNSRCDWRHILCKHKKIDAKKLIKFPPISHKNA